MSNDQGEAIFHAAKLLQLYEETESIEAVTEAATALLANRPTDHVRQVAWFLPPELIRVLWLAAIRHDRDRRLYTLRGIYIL
jgi:hypothetical protein